MSALAIFAQLFGGEREAEDSSEQFLRFVVSEKQIIAVDESDRVLRTQTRQSQRRHLARDDHQMQQLRQVSDQSIEHRMHLSIAAQMMVIVEHDDQRLLSQLEKLV